MDIQALILNWIQQNPNLASILVVMGLLRAVFKPIFAVADAYVQATESKEDDVKLEEIKQSKVIKALEFVLDYVASVKIK